MSISVVICTYNGCSFVKQQIESILSQSTPIGEIIICDDGSNDNTVSAIQSYTFLNPRVNWKLCFNDQPLGITKNFEKALSMCTSDYIFLSDQDDVWEYNKVSEMISFMDRNPDINLAFSDASLINEYDELITSHSLFEAIGFSDLLQYWNAGLSLEIENMGQFLLGCTFVMRREFVMSVLPFSTNIPYRHDGQLAMKAVWNNKVGIIDKKLIRHRIHGNNAVGIKGSWIFNDQKKYDLVSFLFEPRPLNPYFSRCVLTSYNEHAYFIQKRFNCYSSVFGKIRLFFSLPQYVKLYRRFFLRFLSRDLLYGLK